MKLSKTQREFHRMLSEMGWLLLGMASFSGMMASVAYIFVKVFLGIK